jgi:hypothetical protein
MGAQDTARGRNGAVEAHRVRNPVLPNEFGYERSPDRRFDGVEQPVHERQPVQHRHTADSGEHHCTESGRLSGDQDLGRDEQSVLIDAVGQRPGPRPEHQQRTERRDRDPAQCRAAAGQCIGQPRQCHEMQPRTGLRGDPAGEEELEVSKLQGAQRV